MKIIIRNFTLKNDYEEVYKHIEYFEFEGTEKEFDSIRKELLD